MTTLNSLFRWIETRDAVLSFLTLALIAQIPQVAALVLHIVGVSDWLAYVHAYTFAVALDGAILIFVTRGRIGLAWVFAIGSMLMNAAHYMPPVVARHEALWSPLAVVDMAGATLLSVALPFALAQYSHLATGDGVSIAHEKATEGEPQDTPTPSDRSGKPPCGYDGCTNEAYQCEHECGDWVCRTHKGSHNQWRCTHNPNSKAYQGSLNGHKEGV
jgi:hypothetical protein